MSVRTYNPRLVVITYGGVVLRGFAEDAFVRAEPQADDFVSSVGTDGGVTRAAQNDGRWLVTVTLSQSSESNSYLSGKAMADVAAAGTAVTDILAISDLSGTTQLSGKAWIQRRPSVEFARAPGNREWQFLLVEDPRTVIGDNFLS